MPFRQERMLTMLDAIHNLLEAIEYFQSLAHDSPDTLRGAVLSFHLPAPLLIAYARESQHFKDNKARNAREARRQRARKAIAESQASESIVSRETPKSAPPNTTSPKSQPVANSLSPGAFGAYAETMRALEDKDPADLAGLISPDKL